MGPVSHHARESGSVTTHTDETLPAPVSATGRDTRRIQKLLAASLWTVVGGALIVVAGLLVVLFGEHEEGAASLEPAP